MKKIFHIVLFILAAVQAYACNKSQVEKTGNQEAAIIKNDSMKIKIIIGKKVTTGVLYDSPSAKDFASLLPLTLELEDYNNTEKISSLGRKLSTKDAPAGFDPSAGDITYYAPWGNLALFYKDFGYSSGLVSLGKITNGLDALKAKGNFKVTIELDK